MASTPILIDENTGFRISPMSYLAQLDCGHRVQHPYQIASQTRCMICRRMAQIQSLVCGNCGQIPSKKCQCLDKKHRMPCLVPKCGRPYAWANGGYCKVHCSDTVTKRALKSWHPLPQLCQDQLDTILQFTLRDGGI